MQPEIAKVCTAIRSAHRRRVFAMSQRKRADLALLAFLRLQLGWRRDLPAAARKEITQATAAMVKAVEKGTFPPDDDLGQMIAASLQARSSFAGIEAETVKNMRYLARQLPAWASFGAGVRGFGEVSLATIVGEAGNLSDYADHSKLWKRMGLAVMGSGDGLADRRQGGLPSNAPAAAWVEHGYNRERRSRMFVIGDVLMKTQGPYREVYLARKAYEVARAEALGLTVAPAAQILKREAARYRSAGHVHARAQRYMEKRLLRDLWSAWRTGATPSHARDGHLGNADEAQPRLPPRACEPSQRPEHVSQVLAQLDAGDYDLVEADD